MITVVPKQGCNRLEVGERMEVSSRVGGSVGRNDVLCENMGESISIKGPKKFEAGVRGLTSLEADRQKGARSGNKVGSSPLVVHFGHSLGEAILQVRWALALYK